MTGQYISLTPAQAAAFRSQANRIAQEGDEALVKFVEANGNEVYLECDELADVAQKAAEAYDRITAKEEAERQAKKAAPREFTWEQTRANAARVISRYAGFEAVVEAMEADLDRINAKASAEIGRTIAEAMKATRSDGKWVFHSWVRDAMRRVRDQAFEKACAKKGSRK